MYVLKPRESKLLTYFITYCEEKQTSTVSTKPSHYFRSRFGGRPKKISLSFSEIRVKNHHRIPQGESFNRLSYAIAHDYRRGYTYHLFSVEASPLVPIQQKFPISRVYYLKLSCNISVRTPKRNQYRPTPWRDVAQPLHHSSSC